MASKQSVVCALLLCIVYTFSLASANSGAQQKPISVVLQGRVVCHACRLDEENFLGTSYSVAGATVAVECNGGLNRKMNGGLISIEGETDKNGEFKVELPSSIISSILLSSTDDDDHNSTFKGYCSARLLSSPHDKCNVPSPLGSSSDQLIFTPDGSGIRTFTFPSLSYHPHSGLCSHKDITILSDHESLQASRALHEVSTGSSNDLDALSSHGNLPPLPKPKLGFPPLDLPRPPSQPLWNFPHFHGNVPPLPAGIPFAGSSNDMDTFSHEKLPPLAQSKLGFPPLPQPFLNFPPLPESFPPLPIPQPPPQPFFNIPPLPENFPPFLNIPPLSENIPPLPSAVFPPLPAGIPFPWPPPFSSTFPSRFHADP